jgi:hypothetical protein
LPSPVTHLSSPFLWFSNIHWLWKVKRSYHRGNDLSLVNKSPSSVFTSRFLLEPHSPISDRSFHQKVKLDVNGDRSQTRQREHTLSKIENLEMFRNFRTVPPISHHISTQRGKLFESSIINLDKANSLVFPTYLSVTFPETLASPT